MTSLSFVFLIIGVAINLGNVRALSDDEKTNIHAGLLPFIAECSKEYGVTEDQIKEAKESGQIGAINPCLMGCIFKKVNVISEKGLFDPEKAEEITKKFLTNEDDQKKALDIIKTCTSVNEQEVSDGEAGCDRAKLLYECFIPFKGVRQKRSIKMFVTFIKLIFYTTVLLNLRAMAVNMEELKQQYLETIMNCAKDITLSGDDIEQLKNKQMPDNENAKCLFACAYKTSGMMDDQGNLSIEGVNKIAEMYLANDPDRLEQAKKFTDACKNVNDVSVSDGNKGCERAALIFKCSIEKGPQAMTDKELKEKFTTILMSCIKDHPVDMSEALKLQHLIVPTNREVKCLLACGYKKLGSMNSDGMYDIEKGYKLAEMVKSGKADDNKRFENAKKLVDICSKVNDETVSDGKEGCDRAALIFKCSIDNAVAVFAEIDFDQRPERKKTRVFQEVPDTWVPGTTPGTRSDRSTPDVTSPNVARSPIQFRLNFRQQKRIDVVMSILI
ncbi:uncharacterized protein LOC126769748 [Nymphalis io]|uniref:uncharacterized protein LOC126769748 n=1 Tax=Inachis io TaxID=171585 RepID=UPI0021687C68|nr:uncharacterized protein LOC126769748 [Nymphalis io]